MEKPKLWKKKEKKNCQISVIAMYSRCVCFLLVLSSFLFFLLCGLGVVRRRFYGCDSTSTKAPYLV